MYKFKIIIALICIAPLVTIANTDSTKFISRISMDSSKQKLNMDAIYNRPFLAIGKLPVAIGGYIEANTQYAQTDGVSDGFSFQMRRMTLFFSSTIAKKIKFMSEMEFENGTKEINIETALMDIEFHPMLTFRGGIIMNPIGAFNQNHDGPRWDFIDRPISATEIIPSTLSNVGMGFYGKYFEHNWIIGYEAYLTNGFDDKVIQNELGRTSLHEAKENADKFDITPSGLPTFTGKIAVRNRKLGELGISYMTGVYNTWKKDGLIVDSKRSASVLAIDFNTSLLNSRVNITGEICKAMVDLPPNYLETFGSQQLGGYVDLIFTVLQKRMMGWDNAKLNIGVRFDYADYNIMKIKSTQQKIGDEVWAIVPCIAFRPAGVTVLRLNYRIQREVDFFNNAPSKTGAIQLGFSTYF